MEAPVVAEQHGDVGALEVRGDDVGTAITIHVGCAQALVRMAAYGVLRARRCEAALAVSEYDCDFVLGPALDGYVDVAVAVEVGGVDAVRVRFGENRERRAGSWMESTFAIAEQQRELRHGVVGDGEIEMAVVIEVGDGDVVGLWCCGEGRSGHRTHAAAAID